MMRTTHIHHMFGIGLTHMNMGQVLGHIRTILEARQLLITRIITDTSHTVCIIIERTQSIR